MRYGEGGHWLGAERVDAPGDVAHLAERVGDVAAQAVPLNRFLADLARG